MESEGSKICSNCKREIPAVNYIVHTVHCARNICVCPTCKEPVSKTELQEHHEKMHKLKPCKQCGEKVCGSDMEDHIRDSCALTVSPCRYCSLGLPRAELPHHESYCGSRTERCPDCREYVMIKYQQIHQDTNHGFIKLNDEPVTVRPKLEFPKSFNIARSQTSTPNGSSPNPILTSSNKPLNSPINYLKPIPNSSSNSERQASSSNPGLSNGDLETPGPSRVRHERPGVTVKRTNDRPQVNTSVAAVSKISKNSLSRGAIKKRSAPAPPAPAPPAPAPPNPLRDRVLNSAISRLTDEETRRRELNAYNLAHGLPPVLTAAEKVEKLRKMDALHNREDIETEDYRERLRGRCWGAGGAGSAGGAGEGGHLLGSGQRSNQDLNDGFIHDGNHDQINDFSNLTPMTTEEFMNRFQQLQLAPERRSNKETRDKQEKKSRKRQNEAQRRSEQDRFSDIKSSLRELRRGLNEVTAPYNGRGCDCEVRSGCGCDGGRAARPPPAPAPAPALAPAASTGEDVHLPCEFCATLVPADELVLHQTGCRPDLTSRSPSPTPRREPPPPASEPYDHPVIPCEFCTESLPVYLINEHQERCRRDGNLLYPD